MTSKQDNDIQPGDIYEDCAFHPVLCTHRNGDDVEGISLVDGSLPRTCSIRDCGVIKPSIKHVSAVCSDWPGYLARRKTEFEYELRHADQLHLNQDPSCH